MPDLPEEAVEAATETLRKLASAPFAEFEQGMPIRQILAAAAPHIRADERARVLDEVQAALRDEGAMQHLDWLWHEFGEDALVRIADYLHDTLTPEET